MTVDLNSMEQQLVLDLIRHELTEIPSEVRRTQTTSYRDELKTREECLRSLLKKFEETE